MAGIWKGLNSNVRKEFPWFDIVRNKRIELILEEKSIGQQKSLCFSCVHIDFEIVFFFKTKKDSQEKD